MHATQGRFPACRRARQVLTTTVSFQRVALPSSTAARNGRTTTCKPTTTPPSTLTAACLSGIGQRHSPTTSTGVVPRVDGRARAQSGQRQRDKPSFTAGNATGQRSVDDRAGAPAEWLNTPPRKLQFCLRGCPCRPWLSHARVGTAQSCSEVIDAFVDLFALYRDGEVLG